MCCQSHAEKKLGTGSSDYFPLFLFLQRQSDTDRPRGERQTGNQIIIEGGEGEQKRGEHVHATLQKINQVKTDIY